MDAHEYDLRRDIEPRHRVRSILVGILLLCIGGALGVGAVFEYPKAHSYIEMLQGNASMTQETTTESTGAVSSTSAPASENASSDQSTSGSSQNTPLPVIVPSNASTTEPAEYTDVRSWQIVNEVSAGFTMLYPDTFSLDQGSVTPTNSWRVDSQDPGIEVLSITVPPGVEPNTNFVGATISVGYSQNSDALTNCFVAPNGDSVSTSTESVNGIKFIVYSASSVGAGQTYTTTSYRTTHAGACYAVEYTVHTTERSNFPTGDGYSEYNEAEINDILNRVVGTFTFL